MTEKVKAISVRLWAWFVVSVWIVGAPSVVWFSGLGVVKTIFSAQCIAIGSNCDAGWSAPPKVVVDIPGFQSEGFTDDRPAKRH